jgi:hypothetical protein
LWGCKTFPESPVSRRIVANKSDLTHFPETLRKPLVLEAVVVAVALPKMVLM